MIPFLRLFPYRAIAGVPAVSSSAPIRDFTVNCSCKNAKASTSAITTLILSSGPLGGFAKLQCLIIAKS